MKTIESRELHEECGVVGFYGVDHAAAHAFLALQALQHRGQQGCGIAALGPDGSIGLHKGAGLVKDVFGKEEIASLPGSACIGHVRYPTTDVGGQENLQPFLFTRQGESFALAHNGNIVNAAQVKQFLERRGHLFHSTSDSELFACLVGTGTHGRDWEANICAATNLLDGAFATVLLVEGTLYACRDKYGFRPLSLGRLGSGYVVASETCALEAVGAVFERDIEPGELVAIDRNGVHSSFIARNCSRCMCAMEYIYFARPDSVIEGCSVHAFRRLSGRPSRRSRPGDLRPGIQHERRHRLCRSFRPSLGNGSFEEYVRGPDLHPAHPVPAGCRSEDEAVAGTEHRAGKTRGRD